MPGRLPMTRERAEEYRRLAQECLAMARTASTPEGRSTLIDMAETWLRRAEEQKHAGSSLQVPPQPGPVEDRPVVRQQQQVQPKDESE